MQYRNKFTDAECKLVVTNGVGGRKVGQARDMGLADTNCSI